jgi:hypothetical protein
MLNVEIFLLASCFSKTKKPDWHFSGNQSVIAVVRIFDTRYGASQCGPLNNALNPTLGLKNSFIALIFRYIPLHTFGANHFYKGGNQKRVRF